jgi:formate hydrogenlyase subunit 3/multisubunit Na+/H+ antiporter MnhD subunit
MTALSWLAPVLLPLLAAPLAMLVARGRSWLPVLAAVPALVLASTGPPGPAPDLAWILLDVHLALDPASRVLLALTAIVWLAAGVAARPLSARHGGFVAAWLVTLAGNVGLLLAADVVTFYTSYAAMTFAAYGLIVHDRTPEVRRAGRVYLVLAVLGEALLLGGLVLAVGRTGETSLASLASALAGAAADGTVHATAPATLITALLLAGFAVKAGIVPLHVWLPLAHPAAPVAASAVLSGALIKAGLVGWLRLSPLGIAPLTVLGAALAVAGMLSAFLGVALAMTQERPKIVLAYSSVSQMGLIAAVVGVGLLVPEAAPAAVAAAVTYAFHHGLAKGALFLGVGVHARTTDRRGRRLAVAGTVLAGAALAGTPLTSGAIAKAAAKPPVGALPPPWDGRLTLAMTLAAVGTTLVVARVVVLLHRAEPPNAPVGRAAAATGLDAGATSPASPDRSLVVGWLLLLAATAVASWLVPWRLLGEPAPGLPTVGSLAEAAWPVLVGVAITALALWLGGRDRSVRWSGTSQAATPPRWRVPAGDVLVVLEPLAAWLGRAGGRAAVATTASRGRLAAAALTLQRTLRPGEGFGRLDRWLTRWRPAGVLLVLLAAALVVTLRSGT